MRTVFELTSQSKTSKNGRQGQLAPNSNNLANNLALDGNPSHFNVIIIQDWNLFPYASWQFKFTVGSWIISQSLLIGSRYQSSYSPVYSFIAIVGASLINQLLVKWVVSSGNLFLFSSFRRVHTLTFITDKVARVLRGPSPSLFEIARDSTSTIDHFFGMGQSILDGAGTAQNSKVGPSSS